MAVYLGAHPRNADVVKWWKCPGSAASRLRFSNLTLRALAGGIQRPIEGLSSRSILCTHPAKAAGLGGCGAEQNRQAARDLRVPSPQRGRTPQGGLEARQAGILPKNSIFFASQLSGDDDVARTIHAVHLEYVLSEISADGANLHLNRERLGEEGMGNCRRYRETCR